MDAEPRLAKQAKARPQLSDGSIHIALFLSRLAIGGAQRVFVTLANGLADRGARVDLVVAGGGEAFLDDLDPRVTVVSLGAPRMLASIPGLIRYLRTRRPDVLLTTQLHANLVALWAVRLSRARPRVVVRQGNVLFRRGYSTRTRLLVVLAGRYYPRAHAVIAVSRGVADDLARVLGVPPEHVPVIYNPVVQPALMERAKAVAAHPWFESATKPIVVSAGRLSRQKDYATLIRAFHRLRERLPARLVILGEGHERGRLEALIRELGLESHVSLPGAVENPLAFIARASIYVLSSLWEGLPNALIEALAVGVPVVATDCHAGPREILDGGKYGRLVRPGDPKMLAEHMLEVIREPAAEVPTPAYLSRFSVDTCVDAYFELLRA